MNLTTKGFSTTQVFVFISSLIVMAVVVVFGMQAIGSFSSRGCDIELADFVTTFEGEVNRISQEFGSRSQLQLALPCSADVICMADVDFYNDPLTLSYLNSFSPLVQNSFEQEVSNVFVLQGKQILHELYVPRIVVEDSSNTNVKALCLQADIVALRLDGTGRETEITLWSE